MDEATPHRNVRVGSSHRNLGDLPFGRYRLHALPAARDALPIFGAQVAHSAVGVSANDAGAFDFGAIAFGRTPERNQAVGRCASGARAVFEPAEAKFATVFGCLTVRI